MQRRIFVALGLNDESLEKIDEAVKRWQWLPIRWISRANWHITLIPPFYADQRTIEKTVSFLKRETAAVSPFSISFDAVSLAPPDRKARMVWLSGKTSMDFKNLKERLEWRLADQNFITGFRKESRIAVPHVTLARFGEGDLREVEEKTRTLERLPLMVEVSALDIMESKLGAGGAEYSIVERVPFGGYSQKPAPFEFLPHTADFRIRSSGKTLEELFQNALRGMAFYMKEEALDQTPMVERSFKVSASDKTALLVDFLSKALTLADANREVYSGAKFEEFSETHLKGAFRGTPVGAFDKDIKAATYHGAEIKKTAQGYEVTIVYDI